MDLNQRYILRTETPSVKSDKCPVRSRICLFWWLSWICKWAKFDYFLRDLKQRYIWKIETLAIKSVGCRQNDVLFGSYICYFGRHVEFANKPNVNDALWDLKQSYIFSVFTLGLHLHNVSLSMSESVSESVHPLLLNSLQASVFVVGVQFLNMYQGSARVQILLPGPYPYPCTFCNVYPARSRTRGPFTQPVPVSNSACPCYLLSTRMLPVAYPLSTRMLPMVYL